MTDDEKRAQMDQRNAAICAYYQSGHKLKECASQFKLIRQRILQILQQAGVWKPYVKNERTKFLGINVSEQTKDALKRRAEQQGTSVSQLASDVLDDAVDAGVRRSIS
jgi:predicted HicB family RNase H-like nuclease